MANIGVLRGSGRASRKRAPCQSLCEPIPRRRRSCLQKRRHSWGKVIFFDAHGGSVNVAANSSTQQGHCRNPESQNVENRVIVKFRNPKGKVGTEGGERSVRLSWSALTRRMEELKCTTKEVKFMLEEGSADPRANKRGSVRRRSEYKGPAVPRNKRMNRNRRSLRKTDSGLHSKNSNIDENAIVLPLNEGDHARNCIITIVDCKDGDSTTSQLQSSSVSGPEKIHPQHRPTGLLIDVDDEREEPCKRWSSRRRAEKRAVRLVRRNQVSKLDKHLDTNIIDKYMESHWNLLILCHFGEDFSTQARTPCMLLLDSLKETNPNRLEPLIRKFLIEIYKEEGRQDGDKIIAKIPLLVPEVPQQTNGNDCGVFLLHFIDLFLQSAPENFSISNGCYPYFLTKDWFKCDEIGKRRKDIYNMCLEEQHPVSEMTNRRISTRSKKFHRFVRTDYLSNWIDLSSAA